MLRNRVAEEKSSRSFDLCAAPNVDSGTFGNTSTLQRLLAEPGASRIAKGTPKRIGIFDIAVYSRVFRILLESDFASTGVERSLAERIARARRGSGGKKIRKVVDTKKMRG